MLLTNWWKETQTCLRIIINKADTIYENGFLAYDKTVTEANGILYNVQWVTWRKPRLAMIIHR